jgi:hypothetical protein
MMRNEEEIRAHIRDLRAATALPCTCKGTAHEFHCAVGGAMMEAALQALDWALGGTGMQKTVDRMRRQIAETLGSN